jgi:hypothetical protein
LHLRMLEGSPDQYRDGNSFRSMVKAKGTVVVSNISVVVGCPVAKRGSQLEKNKTAGEKWK